MSDADRAELTRLTAAAAHAMAAAPRLAGGSAEREANRRRFFHDLLEIGRLLTCNPPLRSDAAVAGLVAGAAGGLPEFWIDVLNFIASVDSVSVSGWGAPAGWLRICEGRSALAFFLDLFAGLVPQDERAGLTDSLAGLDEGIREKGSLEGHLPDDEIPTCIPRTHWWWWWPRSA